MVFIITSFFLYLCALIENKKLFNVSFFLVVIFYCFTLCYGYDWMNYLDSYENINNPDYIHFFYEPAYLLIMKVFNLMGVPFLILWSMSVFFIYYSVYLFCKKMKAPSSAFFVIFSCLGYVIFSETIRQGIALCICLYSIGPYLKGNKKTAIFLVLLASSFHFTALLFFFTLMLTEYNVKKNRKFILYSCLFVFMFLFFIYNPSLLQFIPGIGNKFYMYSQAYAWDNGGFIMWLLTSRVFILYLVLLLVLFSMLQKSKDHKIKSTISSVFFLCLTRMTPVLIRFGCYMIPVLVFSMDDYLSKYGKGMKTKVLKLSFLTIVFIISIIPFVNPIYMSGSIPDITIFSSNYDMQQSIDEKCGILNKDETNAVIRKCWSTK